MEINSAYQTQNIWDLDATSSVELSSKSSSGAKAAQNGGDTVEISTDARELFSQMNHKVDGSNVSTQAAIQDSSPNGGNQSDGSGVSSSAGTTASGTSADSLRSQIQALKSQLASASSSEDGSASGQTSGLNAQIAALEAQLAAAESAG